MLHSSAHIPLVSVVIPTYNQPVLLLETLRSVFAQTFTDYEIVVVNDGSTDDTIGRLAPFADKIRLINQPNAGVGAARNRGIDEARGEYVALLDHDDLWMPEKLSLQAEFLEGRPQAVGVTVPWVFSSTYERCAFDQRIFSDGFVDRPFRRLADGNLFITSSALMFRRSAARGLRYAPVRRCIEDVPFQVGLLARGSFGLVGDRILAIHRDHDSNASGDALYYFNGIQMLRRMDADGRFDEIQGRDRDDLLAFFASIGAHMLRCQLSTSSAWKAGAAYLRELPHLVRFGHRRLALQFPIYACISPRTRRFWRKSRR